MCKACEENYGQLEDAAKQEVANDLRGLSSAFVSAAVEGKKNPVEIAVALEIARRYTRAQMDEQVLAIVDDLAARGAEMVLEQFRREGKTIEPKPHSPMTFGPSDVPRLLEARGRPARSPGPAGARRATWRN